MTDSELQSQYAGYSDQQLAEFIASGIPDWQAEQFRRLLMLRRREHYLRQIDSPQEPSGVGEQHQQANPPKLPPQKQPTTPSNPEKKKRSNGCGCLILIIIAVIFFLIFASSMSQY